MCALLDVLIDERGQALPQVQRDPTTAFSPNADVKSDDLVRVMTLSPNDIYV